MHKTSEKPIGNWLFQKDEQLLEVIQRRFANPKLRPLMAFLSHPPYWRYIVLGMVLMAFFLGNNHLRWQIGLIVLAIFLSDQTCNILKAIFKRIRPDGLRDREGNFWKMLGYYSLPSSHTANNFVLAIIAIQWWNYLGWALVVWSALVGFSRVYLRNHYPLDIVVGAGIGMGYGLLLVRLFRL